MIETTNNASDNVYIKGMELNRKNYDGYQLSHKDMVKGGKLGPKKILKGKYRGRIDEMKHLMPTVTTRNI